MNDSKIAVRYAKALFLLSQEQKQLDEVAKDIKFLLEVDDHSHTISQLFADPTLSFSKKKTIVSKTFEAAIGSITQRFLALLIENRRESSFKAVAYNFMKRYRVSKGIKEARIISADTMSEAQKEGLVKLIKDTYQSEVELKVEENKDLIGGFILKVDDIEFDGSIKTKLEQVKQYLLK